MYAKSMRPSAKCDIQIFRSATYSLVFYLYPVILREAKNSHDETNMIRNNKFSFQKFINYLINKPHLWKTGRQKGVLTAQMELIDEIFNNINNNNK